MPSLWSRATPAPAPAKPRPRFRLEALEDRTTPAVHEWTGLGSTNLWSDSLNWTNGSPAGDAFGDVDLVFHTNLTNAAKLVTQNDITGLVVDSITFDANPGTVGPTTFATGGPSSAGYTINGNTITLATGDPGQDLFGIDVANGVASASGHTQTFNAGITLIITNATFRSLDPRVQLTFTGPIDLGTRTLTIDNTTLGGSQGVTISGAISNGNLTKNGNGTLDLSGNNSYANTTVNSGRVLVRSDTGLGSTAGTVTVNDPGQIQLRNGVTVVKTLLNLNSNQLGGGLGADGNTTNTWRGNVVLMSGAGGVALGAGTGAANAGTRLVIDGVISGATSTLSLNGAGVIEFTKNNTYTGITDINGNQGFTTLQIDTPAGLGAGGDPNRTIIRNAGGGQPGGTVALNFNGTLQDAGGTAEEIDFAGSGVGALGAIRSLGNANVLIPGNITFIAAAPWVFGVDGAAGSITLTGVIDSQGLTRALTKIGPGTLIVGGAAANVFQGGVVVNGGVLRVTNTSATPLGTLAGPSTGLVTVNNGGTLRVETGATVTNPVQLNAGGTLAGTGIVTGTVTSTGGTVSPGTGTGVLTVGPVTLNTSSAFRAELNGTTVGTLFDQLGVTGTVNLGGAALNVVLGFTPAVNDSFILIANDLADPVVGTFAGVPQGGTVDAGGTRFAVSYTGGTGNDVVLTALGPAPTPPAAPAPAPPRSPAPAAPFFSGAVVLGNLLVLQGAGAPGGVQVIEVPFGSFALLTDTNGDGNSELILVLPNLVAVLDGVTGTLAAVFVPATGQLFLFNPDGSPKPTI